MSSSGRRSVSPEGNMSATDCASHHLVLFFVTLWASGCLSRASFRFLQKDGHNPGSLWQSTNSKQQYSVRKEERLRLNANQSGIIEKAVTYQQYNHISRILSRCGSKCNCKKNLAACNMRAMCLKLYTMVQILIIYETHTQLRIFDYPSFFW